MRVLCFNGWCSVVVVAVLALAGCTNERDALYRHAGEDAGDSPDAGEPELPLLPGRPDEARVIECTKCAARECGAQRQACLDSAMCREMLACKGQCWEPNCMTRCSTLHPLSLAFEDYFGCVFGNGPIALGEATTIFVSRCPGECGSANNWECVERGYRWDQRPDSEPVVIELEMPGPNWGGGWEIAPCVEAGLFAGGGIADGCVGWVPTDAYGRARLQVDPGTASDGVFGVRNVDDEAEKLRIYERPMAHSGPLRLQAATVGLANLAASIAHANDPSVPELDPSLGLLAFWPLDCLGVPAPATVALPGIPGSEPYYGRGGFLVRDTPYEQGFFMNLRPTPQAEVIATVGERIVSRRNVSIAPSLGLTEVALWPLDSLSSR